jgi:hypothetical protein
MVDKLSPVRAMNANNFFMVLPRKSFQQQDIDRAGHPCLVPIETDQPWFIPASRNDFFIRVANKWHVCAAKVPRSSANCGNNR